MTSQPYGFRHQYLIKPGQLGMVRQRSQKPMIPIAIQAATNRPSAKWSMVKTR